MPKRARISSPKVIEPPPGTPAAILDNCRREAVPEEGKLFLIEQIMHIR